MTFFMKRIEGCFFIQNAIKIMTANIIKKMFLLMNFYRINKYLNLSKENKK